MRAAFARDRPEDRTDALGRISAAVAVESGEMHSVRSEESADFLLPDLVVPHDKTWQVDREVAVALGSLYLGRSLTRPAWPDAAELRERGRQLLSSFWYAPDPPELPAWLAARLGEVGLPAREWLDEVGLVAERRRGELALGGFLARGGEILGSEPWFVAARELLEEAYEHLAVDSIDRAVAAGRLGIVHAALGPQAGGDLERILHLLAEARRGVPAEHVDHAGVVGLLGRLLCQSALTRQDPAMLAEAITCLREAVDTATFRMVRPVLAMTYAALAHALIVRSAIGVATDEADLTLDDEAIDAMRHAVDLTADVPAARLTYLDGLHEALRLVPPSAAGWDEIGDVLCARRDLTEPDEEGYPDLTLRAAEALIESGRGDEARAVLEDPRLGHGLDDELRERAEELRGRLGDEPGAAVDEPGSDDLLAYLNAAMGPDGGSPQGGVQQILLEMLGLGEGAEETRFAQGAGLIVKGVVEGRTEAAMGELIARAVSDALSGIGDPSASAEQLPADLPVRPGTVHDPVLRAELIDIGRRLHALADPGSMGEIMLRGRLLALEHAERQDTPGLDENDSMKEFLGEFLPLLGETLQAVRGRAGDKVGLGPLFLTMNAGGTAFEKLETVDAYVAASRAAMAALGRSTEERRAASTHLATALFSRFLGERRQDAYEEATALAREALSGIEVVHREQFALFSIWMQAAGLHGTTAHTMETIVASDIAGGDAASALEEIERDASALLGHDITSRRDAAAMEAANPALHQEYVAAVDARQEQLAITSYSRFLTPAEEQAQVDAQVRLARVIQEVRAAGDLGRFLTEVPLSVRAMRPAARDGAVITFNLSELRCDAVVLHHEGEPQIVPLPDLRLDELHETARRSRMIAPRAVTDPSLYGKPMRNTLSWLWDVVVGPVLDALGHLPAGADRGAPRRLPRVWWMPTGQLHGLPLHAAERFGEPGSAALDRVVSSYTPNVRSLLHSLSSPQARQPMRLLTVAASRADVRNGRELESFRGEITEIETLLGLAPDQIVRPEATVGQVLEAIGEVSLAHFACHAGAIDSGADHLVDSVLFLADGEITARQVADRRSTLGELAYLSACDSAALSQGATDMGEVVHIGSAFQAAGFRQTVSTLWPVLDRTAREASASFYAGLAGHVDAGSPLPAARVLHETVQELRRATPTRPELWAGLVHSGA